MLRILYVEKMQWSATYCYGYAYIRTQGRAPDPVKTSLKDPKYSTSAAYPGLTHRRGLSKKLISRGKYT